MLKDKRLEKQLLNTLSKLERLNDSVGPTPVRHALSNHIVLMRCVIWNFDPKRYEEDQDYDPSL